MERGFLAVHDDGMPRVVSALKADHIVDLLSQKIGTTGRGIGPCYEDKVGRVGVRASDLADPDLLKAKIAAALKEKNVLFTALYGIDALAVDATLFPN